jgi:hypothetical protein
MQWLAISFRDRNQEPTRCAKVIWKDLTNRYRIKRMAMTRRLSVTLDSKSEAALYSIVKRTGWNRSQVLREAIKAAAESQGLARRAVPGQPAANKMKVKS